MDCASRFRPPPQPELSLVRQRVSNYHPCFNCGRCGTYYGQLFSDRHNQTFCSAECGWSFSFRKMRVHAAHPKPHAAAHLRRRMPHHPHPHPRPSAAAAAAAAKPAHHSSRRRHARHALPPRPTAAAAAAAVAAAPPAAAAKPPAVPPLHHRLQQLQHVPPPSPPSEPCDSSHVADSNAILDYYMIGGDI